MQSSRFRDRISLMMFFTGNIQSQLTENLLLNLHMSGFPVNDYSIHAEDKGFNLTHGFP